MVIVDLQELENQARMAEDSIAGVVLEPEAMLLIVHEIRRLKKQLETQHARLNDLQEELVQIHAVLARTPAHPRSEAVPPKRKTLSMKVGSKNSAQRTNAGQRQARADRP